MPTTPEQQARERIDALLISVCRIPQTATEFNQTIGQGVADCEFSLPPGTFYRPGVKANVLFFEKYAPRADGKPNTRALWVYDPRTNKNFTLRKTPLQRTNLDGVVDYYQGGRGDQRQESGRFRRFGAEELLQRDKLNLDICWLKDDSLDDMDNLPPPDEIAAQTVENLQPALEPFQSVADELGTQTQQEFA